MSTNESDYGRRFADAWTQLQVYLAELDPGELESLATQDVRGTVELLARQPELGSSSALRDAGAVGPEELAVRLLGEKLEALRLGPEGAGASFGAQFLEAWRELGGTLSSFSYATLQRLKQADRSEAVAILARSMGPGARPRALGAATPRELAGRLLVQRQVGTAVLFSLFY